MAVRTSFARVGSWWYIDKRGKKNLGSVHGPTYLSRLLNFIRKIQSQLPQSWKRLERWEYNTSASKRSRKLTVSSKCIKAHGIVTEYIFSHSPVPQAPDLDRVDNAHARNKHYSIQNYTIQSFRGAHRCASMDCGSTKADRLYTITKSDCIFS